MRSYQRPCGSISFGAIQQPKTDQKNRKTKNVYIETHLVRTIEC